MNILHSFTLLVFLPSLIIFPMHLNGAARTLAGMRTTTWGRMEQRKDQIVAFYTEERTAWRGQPGWWWLGLTLCNFTGVLRKAILVGWAWRPLTL